jgi:F-type H+-transporting ATPase subunit epsilon
MPETFLLEVATPERRLVAEQAAKAQIPAASGYVGILPGHAALRAELGTGTLSFTASGQRRSLTVSGGWLEVASGHVRVLAHQAKRAPRVARALARCCGLQPAEIAAACAESRG